VATIPTAYVVPIDSGARSATICRLTEIEHNPVFDDD